MLPFDFDARKEGTDAGNQVALIARRLDAQQIVLQQALEDLPAPRQLFEDIRRREGDVHEEGQGSFRTFLANIFAHVHQLIILYPDDVIRLRGLECDGSEALIDPLIVIPVARRKVTARLKVVKEWPQNLVREALVEAGLLLCGQEDWKVAHRGATGGGSKQLAYLCIVCLTIAGEAGAAHPGSAIFREDWGKRADQATARRYGRRLTALVPLDGDWQPV